ncbi:YbaK family protein [Peribacillus tepidiphilus]|jgi:hypothetical protein|uniref:YbaK family protein n=1 Tax=Peribacillus tepidiphilus TaxID=2652445 RepID=UPI001291222E|nr:YbaK family protein [Peribacillus tepidiphilus]
MNVITNLKERQREKQIKYERTVLREMSPKLLKERVQTYLFSNHRLGVTYSEIVEEGCFDVAIEAFLLGANFSKFGYYGETAEEAKKRCEKEEKHLIDTLFNFILYWGKVGDYDLFNESLYYQCEQYVNSWWIDGFEKGKRRYKLRLH